MLYNRRLPRRRVYNTADVPKASPPGLVATPGRAQKLQCDVFYDMVDLMLSMSDNHGDQGNTSCQKGLQLINRRLMALLNHFVYINSLHQALPGAESVLHTSYVQSINNGSKLHAATSRCRRTILALSVKTTRTRSDP